MLQRNDLPCILLAVLLAAGCAQARDVCEAPEARPAARERLAVSTPMDVEVRLSVVEVTARRIYEGEIIAVAHLPLSGGRLELWARPDGALVLDALEMALDDVVIDPESLPPTGLRLGGLGVRTEAPVVMEATWTAGGDTAVAQAAAELLFDWVLVEDDGTLVPMPTQRIREVALTVQVVAEMGILWATLDAGVPGTLWELEGVVALSDLRLAVTAREAR